MIANIAPFDIVPCAGRIGAEIHGIRLDAALPTSSFDDLYQALLQHKVLFFKGQHLDDAQQQAFTAHFGPLVAHAAVPGQSVHIQELHSQHGGRVSCWHTNASFEVAYPKVSVQRSVVLPPCGGDTVWANTVAAYNDLPQSLRTLADNLWSVHSNDLDQASRNGERTAGTQLRATEASVSRLYATEHPVVRVHPETGERSLLLGHFVRRILDEEPAESKILLTTLQSYVTRLENTVRWRWSPGDVVIWDNRATQQYAIHDYGDSQCVVRRFSVAGDVPMSLDGRRSRAIRASDVFPCSNAARAHLTRAA